MTRRVATFRFMIGAADLILAAGCAASRPNADRLDKAPTAAPPVIRLPVVTAPQSEIEPCSVLEPLSDEGAPRLPLLSATVDGDTPSLAMPDFTEDEPLPGLPPAASVPVDLGTVLELAAGRNPQVAFAQARIREAAAQLQAADALWLPSIRAGLNYNKHEGRMQDVEGVVENISRGSLYSGLGAQAVGAGSPAIPGLVMSFHTRDALFQPRIAASTMAARQQAGQAVMQDLLTDTAVAYMNLLEAVQNQVIARETQDNLQSLADLTASFARSGAGLPADADRARAELLQQRIESRRAEENVQVAAVRLAQLLSLDPTLTLLPQETAVSPLNLVSAELPLSELVATGLVNRPELAENRFLVSAAVERLRRERYAPLLPSVLLGASYGVNGGGVGGNLINFGDRMDLDAIAWWEIRNFGLGEQAARMAAQSQLAQTRSQQVRMMDQVACEVAQAHAQVTARHDQIELAQSGILAAGDSYRRNSERIHNAQGLPIEVLQSVQALNTAQRQYARAVADYNRAQFQLQRALGWPIAPADAE